MLVLTRRVGETIVIGSDVRVTILGLEGHQVRIGVAAPKDVIVDREEIADRRRAELVAKTLAEGSIYGASNR